MLLLNLRIPDPSTCRQSRLNFRVPSSRTLSLLFQKNHVHSFVLSFNVRVKGCSSFIMTGAARAIDTSVLQQTLACPPNVSFLHHPNYCSPVQTNPGSLAALLLFFRKLKPIRLLQKLGTTPPVQKKIINKPTLKVILTLFLTKTYLFSSELDMMWKRIPIL